MLLRKSKKLFVHIDCDSFFASCEIYANPKIKGKFVCVGGEIILASTYNCKALGIKTGTPVWEARNILGSKGIFLLPNFSLYNMISQNLLNYLKKHTLLVEPFSIDEAFCEITGLPEYYKLSKLDYLFKLQNEILNLIGVPVSIGCAETRIKAKIFSKLNKPFGIYLGIDTNVLIDLYKELPIKEIPFVGKKTQFKLKYKCTTIYDFVSLGFWHLKKTYGKSISDLWLELVGINSFKLTIKEKPQSISKSRSFNKNLTNDIEFLWKQLKIHFENVFIDIVEKKLEIKRVSILFRDKSFRVFIYEYKFSNYVNERYIIYNELKKLFITNYNSNIIYRSIGIIVSDLRASTPKQITIFDRELYYKGKNELYDVVNLLNKKYGEGKIAFGKNRTKKSYYFKTKCY